MEPVMMVYMNDLDPTILKLEMWPSNKIWPCGAAGFLGVKTHVFWRPWNWLVSKRHEESLWCSECNLIKVFTDGEKSLSIESDRILWWTAKDVSWDSYRFCIDFLEIGINFTYIKLAPKTFPAVILFVTLWDAWGEGTKNFRNTNVFPWSNEQWWFTGGSSSNYPEEASHKAHRCRITWCLSLCFNQFKRYFWELSAGKIRKISDWQYHRNR